MDRRGHGRIVAVLGAPVDRDPGRALGLEEHRGGHPTGATEVEGDPGAGLFGKLYARSHLRSDRWYKLGRTLLYGRLEDRFGDNGLISVIIGQLQQSTLYIDLWIMSCRVLKRDMELSMLDALVARAAATGVERIIGRGPAAAARRAAPASVAAAPRGGRARRGARNSSAGCFLLRGLADRD